MGPPDDGEHPLQTLLGSPLASQTPSTDLGWREHYYKPMGIGGG